jgi:hypothetical protein
VAGAKLLPFPTRRPPVAAPDDDRARMAEALEKMFAAQKRTDEALARLLERLSRPATP